MSPLNYFLWDYVKIIDIFRVIGRNTIMPKMSMRIFIKELTDGVGRGG